MTITPEMISNLRQVILVAESIRKTVGTCSQIDDKHATPTHSLHESRHIPPPKHLTPHLIELGLPSHMEESQAYLCRANSLRAVTRKIIDDVYSTLAALPRADGLIPLETLHQQVIRVHQQNYIDTLSRWAAETKKSSLSSVSSTGSSSLAPKARHPNKKSKREFKSEYLPLFEFAFEKDRFPSREDKRHLARISGMSYRQVCVWFQNRRCRRKSHSQRPSSAPQTFAEMKARLSASARESLANPSSLRKNCQNQDEHAGTEEVDTVESSPKVLDDTMSSGSSYGTRAVSLEATEDGYESDDQDELVGDGCMGNTTYRLPPSISDNDPTPPLSSPESTSSPASEVNALDSTNSLNPMKTHTAHVYPAVYKPSALTSDPFIVEHQPWLRYPGAPRTRSLIDPTPEAMEDILGGFNGMDVDDVDVTETKKPLPLPRRNVSTNSSSCGSEPSLSRSSSYSTISSSCSDLSFMTPSDCTEELPSEFAPSPVSDCENNTWTSVKTWTETPKLKDQSGSSKWEQLLAAASVAAS
ncbi:hypothetical protein K439DRAFT_1618869 [Ramaria rubella]|nr:hypothetical protein K439DRAFT_1618869 [Ramaria rubella]